VFACPLALDVAEETRRTPTGSTVITTTTEDSPIGPAYGENHTSHFKIRLHGGESGDKIFKGPRYEYLKGT
jgi:hypothetical protein